MGLDPSDYELFQEIAEHLKQLNELQLERSSIESKMLEIATLNARREFLLLTMAPDRVRDQLVEESGAYIEPIDQIVAKPE